MLYWAHTAGGPIQHVIHHTAHRHTYMSTASDAGAALAHRPVHHRARFLPAAVSELESARAVRGAPAARAATRALPAAAAASASSSDESGDESAGAREPHRPRPRAPRRALVPAAAGAAAARAAAGAGGRTRGLVRARLLPPPPPLLPRPRWRHGRRRLVAGSTCRPCLAHTEQVRVACA